MIQALRVLLGIAAAMGAALMLVFSVWAALFTQHKVHPYEREHLEAAVQFLRARELASGAVPDAAEFNEWARAMDSRGHYRFDGYGYTLNNRCGFRPSDFCIGFWTGDEFVTYRSWQASMEKVSLDDSPLLLVTGLLIAALVAGMAAKALLAPKPPPLPDREAHEG
jgi:hypothetical protein